MGITKEDKKIIQETAENIRQSREKKGWTQGKLAKKAGIDSNSYAKVERGESRPYGVTLVKIIKALGVKSSDILPV